MAWTNFTGIIQGAVPTQYPFSIPTDNVIRSNLSESVLIYNQRYPWERFPISAPWGTDNTNQTYTVDILGNYRLRFNYGAFEVAQISPLKITAGGYNTNYSQVVCGFFINEETQEARMWVGGFSENYKYCDLCRFQNLTMHELYNILKAIIDPQYNLTSLKAINGIDRTLALTKIKDDYINGGEYIYYRDHNALETVGSPVVDLLAGLGVGDSKTLITTYQKNTDIMQLSIKRNNTSGFEIGALYEVGGSKAQFNIDCRGYGSNFFMGVLVDNEKEVATISIIAISDNEVGINYNPPTKDFLALETLSHFLYLIVKGVPRDIDEDDPTGELPPAEDGGGDGDHNYTDDSVKPTPKPSNIATDLGLVTLFTPTNSQLKALASYMWTNDLFDLDNFKKIFADPMDCILSLGVYPFNLEASDNVALSVGNISTGILMNKLSTTEEYHDEKLGYCYIEKQLKTFLDYSPYTKLSVYLPFCSTHQLNADKYIGKNVYIFYRVNVLSGACVVYLCDGGYDGQILDQFSGNVNYNIPLTANNYQQAISSLMGLTLTTAGGVGGFFANKGASVGASLGATATNTAQNIATLKPSIEHTGSLSGNIGSCGHLAPYFIFSCPRLVASDGKNKIIGTPSYVTKTLGDVTGYCEVQNVHVASSLANAREVAEIESLLKGGVYL